MEQSVSIERALPLIGYSSIAECCELNSRVIVKTSCFMRSQMGLYKKYLQFPVLEQYIVPTYIYTLPKIKFGCEMADVHFDYLQSKMGKDKPIEQTIDTDCIVLQPKCQKIDGNTFLNWSNNPKQKELYQYLNIDSSLLDLRNANNMGYLNGEIKVFDW